jgi:hypothetical protein
MAVVRLARILRSLILDTPFGLADLPAWIAVFFK